MTIQTSFPAVEGKPIEPKVYDNNRYCLGALLLDLDDPSIVLARSDEPIMEPKEKRSPC